MKENQTVVIFAGAGASKAVNSKAYPTTVDFFDGLPEEIRYDKIFQEAVAFVDSRPTYEEPDIEKVLWLLEELKTLCDQFTNKNSFPGWAIAENRLTRAQIYSSPKVIDPDELGNNTLNTKRTRDLLQDTSQEISELRDSINTRVYDLYAKLPEPEELDENWNPLLAGLEKLNIKIEIATTNYDLIVEEATRKRDCVDIGWHRDATVRRLRPSLWTLQNERPRGLLTKLHGSVNWNYNEDEIIVSDPTYKGSHEKHPIIYPGFKGRPQDPLFLSFHNYLASALSSATVALFIGFAFRDEYINDICARSLAGNASVGIIDPEEVNHPFDSSAKVMQWETGFDASSVEMALDFTKAALNR